jgi:hypothetical protein
MPLYRWEFRSSGTLLASDRETVWDVARDWINEDLLETDHETQFLREVTPLDPEWQQWIDDCRDVADPSDPCDPTLCPDD